MGNYIVIAEPSADNHSWWISFPALPGVTAAANAPGEIPRKAREALLSRGGSRSCGCAGSSAISCEPAGSRPRSTVGMPDRPAWWRQACRRPTPACSRPGT